MHQEKQARVNKNIKAETVLLIDDDGTNVGNVRLSEALDKAASAGLDLVEVGSGKKIPVCRIMDYGKWRYEQSKRLKKNKNQNQGRGSKEIKFRPNTGDNDLSYRAKRVGQFLKDGYKVKLCVRFKGREIDHMYHTGKDLLERFLGLIPVGFKMVGNAKAEDRSIVQWIGPEDE
jgi:translation initiation factor IF-3